MTAPMPPAAPELSAAMAETRAMRVALAAEAERLDAEAVHAERNRDGSVNGTWRLMQGQRADWSRAMAARLREIARVPVHEISPGARMSVTRNDAAAPVQPDAGGTEAAPEGERAPGAAAAVSAAPIPRHPDGPEFVPEWDVLRDSDGRPVTITWEQVRAVWHAVAVVEAVRRAEGHESLWHIRPSAGGLDAKGNDMNTQSGAELGKSRLLGRMLVDGRPPTRTRPPVAIGGPAWHLLLGGDPFDDETPEASAAVTEPCGRPDDSTNAEWGNPS